MAINQGNANRIAFYPTAGDTIDDAAPLLFYPDRNEFLMAGRNSIIRNTFENRNNGLLNASQYHTTASAMGLMLYRGRGTSTVPASVQEGDQLGKVLFGGRNSTGNAVGGYIYAQIDGTVTTSFMPTKIAVGIQNESGQFENQLEIERTRIHVNKSITTNVGNLTPDFDLGGNGDVSSSDALAYFKLNGDGNPASISSLTNRAWMKGNWSSTAGAYGGLFAVERNAIDALAVTVGLPPYGYGDSVLLGNVASDTGFFKTGVYVLGGTVGIKAVDNNQQNNPIAVKLASTTDGTGGFDITGNLRVTGEVTAYYSDERLKKDITPIQGALSKVLSICGYTYKANDKAEELGVGRADSQIGLLAQEVEAVMPELVTNSAIEGYKTVRYDKLVSVLVNAVKEQQQMIEELRQMVQAKWA